MTREQLVTHQPSASENDATVVVDPSTRETDPIDPKLFGKFGEHLYSTRNAKNTLEAQILHNPTFGSWKFQVEASAVDGGRPAVHDAETKAERIEEYVEFREYPDADRLNEAYRSGLALWWIPIGAGVTTSPDVGTAGDRAQRIEISPASVDGAGDGDESSKVTRPAGIAQWCRLPTHRTRTLEGTVTMRAKDSVDVTLSLHEVSDEGDLETALAETTLSVTDEWTTPSFELELPDDVDDSPGRLFAFSVTSDSPANLVLDRALLYPDDHVNGADPDVIDFLRDAELPILRWPGGNFVSGYHWRDGVGPIEERPTKPNPGWDGLETNCFGTAEFVEFCEEIGCEPLLCINAGNGTPEEAARWVEYCNGSTDTEMGALRAEHGYEEPFDVIYWEIGNEVYGPWQVSWTTPDGYADRFQRFHEAMTDVDDSLELLACGNRLTDWNEPLLSSASESIDWLTDHVLVGEPVGPEVDQHELYNAHMALAEQVMASYENVLADMESAGVDDPRIALTELQLFTFPNEEWGDDRGSADLPTNTSISEAIYDATFVHEAVRSGAVEMITHSGIGNHAAGLRKHSERVWADPCYYYHRMGTALFGATPLEVDLTCATYDTETAFATDTADFFGQLAPVSDMPVIDLLAVSASSGDELLVDLVHRDATGEELAVTIELEDGEDGFEPGTEATVMTLAGETMADENTLEEPENVSPSRTTVPIDGRAVTISVSPFSFVRVAIPRED